MNTYLLTNYVGPHDEKFIDLYQIDVDTKYEKNRHIFFKIIKILFSNEQFLIYKKIDGYYQWMFPSGYQYDGFLNTDLNSHDMIMEFPDEESALLWFNMNY